MSYVEDPITSVYGITEKVHPTFHALFSECWNHLFEGNGQLHKSHRHYVALMAATRHRCLTLMYFHRAMFRKCGGDPDWLLGLSHADARFQLLDEINRNLAHQPWLLKADDIHNIVSRGSPDAVKSFSLVELVNAVCIMAQTHVMCSFICAVGLDERSDLGKAEMNFVNCDEEGVDDEDVDIHDERSDEDPLEKENYDETFEFRHEMRGDVEKLVHKMQELKGQFKRKESTTFGSIDTEEQQGGETPENSEEEEDKMPVFSRFPTFAYIDFQTRPQRNIKVFSIHEFSWDHAYNLIADLTQETARRLDSIFTHTQRLTYKFIGNYDKVDTTMYREAVWNYIQSLYGIKYDDYDYAKVNILLDKQTKSFIKKTACFPHRLTNELKDAMPGFKMSEKIHVLMLVMESRFQAQLLHFTRALCNYTSQSMSRRGYRRPLD